MPSSGRTAKKVIPWDTEPTYTLPPGTDSCPVPTCSAYGKKFEPYWRVNEHMKTDHGWPRKSLQPLSDKRLSKKLKAQRLRERGLSEESSSLSPLSTSDNESGGKPQRKRKFSESTLTKPSPAAKPPAVNGATSSHPQTVNNAGTSSRTLPTIANLLNHEIKPEKVDKPSKLDSHSSLLRLSTRTPPRKSPPRRRPAVPQDMSAPYILIDEELNSAARKFAHMCVINGINSFGTDSHRVADKLNQLVDSKAFKVNAILTREKSEAMLLIYRALADDSKATTNPAQLRLLDQALEVMLRPQPSSPLEMNGGPPFHNTFSAGAFHPAYGAPTTPTSAQGLSRLKMLAPKPLF